MPVCVTGAGCREIHLVYMLRIAQECTYGLAASCSAHEHILLLQMPAL